jgi:AcrR family transcriptional regulator
MTDRHAATREKTQEKIRASFIALLQEKDYTEITVREIASHAGIGFKTLYRHYSDKDVIAREIYEGVWAKLLEDIAGMGPTAKPEQVITQLLLEVQRNAALMRAFVTIGSYQDVLPPFTVAFSTEQLRQYRPDLFERDSPYAAHLRSAIAVHFMEGQIELVRWWLLQDKLTLPMEAMVSLIVQLVVKPIFELQLPDEAP